jgi:hypothetical protein
MMIKAIAQERIEKGETLVVYDDGSAFVSRQQPEAKPVLDVRLSDEQRAFSARLQSEIQAWADANIVGEQNTADLLERFADAMTRRIASGLGVKPRQVRLLNLRRTDTAFLVDGWEIVP